ncbi:DUF6907 domain-containing protein [Streptomyces sp. NPDC088775]|uniref:DUF6907 domain-containing protein n=1 Tax=Streptomyces sp. NPDC088775 TaxID=3365896 RepID=UPI003819DBF8
MTTVLPESPAVPAEDPRTWSFVNRLTGQPEQVTCMLGCTANHSAEMDAPAHPDDVWCQSANEDVFLPVNETGSPEFVRVLSSTLNVMPFSTTIAYRLPHVSIEVMQDSWIEGLDPDGLETVIGTLAERVDQLRRAHAELVRVRAEYRQAGTASND